ncbi:MAG: diphosphomevalonate decarboxylase [Chitinophagales bacterium]|nr:diphosphomevalonate decarboxylase [Chitinophagales bacterium]
MMTDTIQKVAWKSASNIALVKYWGKHSEQIPMNPSISITLENANTQTSIQYNKSNGSDVKVDFLFEGNRKPEFGQKIERFIARIAKDYPLLNEFSYIIESSNSFPHSTGIASSASSMSALAMNLYSILREHGAIASEDLSIASSMSRLGSGSACRSVYPGFAVWGNSEIVDGSHDEYAVEVNEKIHEEFKNTHDSILIVDSAKKSVSSTEGHALMAGHSFRESRIKQSHDNLKVLMQALEGGDWHKFTEIVELEALTLHALMMSSVPSYILLHPNTLKVIELIREFRNATSTAMAFTLDAGPNIHLLYPDYNAGAVKSFINDALIQYCEERKVLHDKAGQGPEKLI